MLKKLLASLLLSIFLLTSLFPKTAHAQTWYNQSPLEWYRKVYDDNVSPTNEIFGERYAAAQVDWIIYSVLSWPFTKTLGPRLTSCLMDPLNLGACVSQYISSADLNVTPIAGIMPDKKESLISLVFQERPISAISYFKGLAQKFKIIPEAQAQEGFGFQRALSPIQGMWKASRDVSFGLFVIIAVIMAFMIMFRVKISPQVVITAQSALPKLVIAIILVTFSYAIAGFLIDLMYVLIGLLSLLGTRFFPAPLDTVITSEMVFNFLTLGSPFALPLQWGAFGLFFFYIFLFMLALAFVMFFMVGALMNLIGAVFAIGVLAAVFPTGAPLIIAIIPMVITIILLLVILWMFIKTIFMLFKAYAMVIILTIFAPFHLALGAVVPSFGFGAWVKSFVSNLAVFVVTGVLFLFAYIFLIQAVWLTGEQFLGADFVTAMSNLIFGTYTTGIISGVGTAGWPPLLGFGAAGNSTVSLLFLGVSFVIFTLIPKAAEVIQGLITGRPFAYGTAIGEAFGLAAAPFGFAREAGMRGVSGALSEIIKQRLTAARERTTDETRKGVIIRGEMPGR